MIIALKLDLLLARMLLLMEFSEWTLWLAVIGHLQTFFCMYTTHKWHSVEMNSRNALAFFSVVLLPFSFKSVTGYLPGKEARKEVKQKMMTVKDQRHFVNFVTLYYFYFLRTFVLICPVYYAPFLRLARFFCPKFCACS